MELQRLYVRVLGDISDLEKKMGKAQRLTSDFGRDMQAVGKGLTIGLTLPLAAVGAASVSAAADLDRLKRGLTAVMGSAGGATAELSKLQQVAKLPGLGFREAIQGSIRLQAAFGDMEGRVDLARNALMAFGNAIATVGGGKAQLDRVTVALSQIAAKGKVSAEEILQLQEALPQIRQAMQDAFGTSSTEELRDMGIGAEEFIRKITEEFAKLPKVTGGAANAFENFTDALFRARAAIGDKLLPVVVPLVEGLASLLEQIEGLDDSTVQNWVAFGAVLAGLGPAIIVVGSLAQTITMLSVAGASLAAVFAVGAPLLIGLGVIAGLWVKNKLEAAAFAGELENIREKAKGAGDALQGMAREQLSALLSRQGGRLAAVRAERQALIEAERARLAGQGQFGVGGVLTDEQIARRLSGSPEFQAAERMIAIIAGAMEGVATQLDALLRGNVPPAGGGGGGGGTGLTSLPGLTLGVANSGAARIMQAQRVAAAQFAREMEWFQFSGGADAAQVARFRGRQDQMNLGTALSGLGGSVGGKAGSLLGSAGGIAAALGTGGAVGAIGLFSAALGGLKDIFGQTESSVERANEAFTRMAENLNLRFAVLDIDNPDEQFQQLLEGFIGQFGTGWAGIGIPGIEGLTPENFDARAPGLLEWLETIRSLPGTTAIEGPFAELIKQLDALSDAIGETTRVLNAPSGFKVSLARFNATDAGGGFGGRPFPGGPREHAGINIEGDLIIQSNDPDDMGRKVERKVARGGVSRLGLAFGGAG